MIFIQLGERNIPRWALSYIKESAFFVVSYSRQLAAWVADKA